MDFPPTGVTITSSIRSSFHKSTGRPSWRKVRKPETSTQQNYTSFSIKGILTILTILNNLTPSLPFTIISWLLARPPRPSNLRLFSGEIAENFSAHPRVSDHPPKDHEQVFFWNAIFYMHVYLHNYRWFKMVFFQNFTTTKLMFCFSGDHRKLPEFFLKNLCNLTRKYEDFGLTGTKWHQQRMTENSGPTGYLSNQNNHHN